MTIVFGAICINYANINGNVLKSVIIFCDIGIMFVNN